MYHPRDPGSPNLRMVSWNLNTLLFGGDCTPRTSSSDVRWARIHRDSSLYMLITPCFSTKSTPQLSTPWIPREKRVPTRWIAKASMASEVESKVSASKKNRVENSTASLWGDETNAPYIAGTCWYKYKHIYILYIIHTSYRNIWMYKLYMYKNCIM